MSYTYAYIIQSYKYLRCIRYDTYRMSYDNDHLIPFINVWKGVQILRLSALNPSGGA